MVDPKVLPRAHRPHRPHQAALVTNSYTVVKHQRGLRGQPWSLRKPELHPKVRPGDGCEETFETTTGSSQDKIWSQFDLKMLILLMFFVGPPSVTQHATMVCFSMVREQWPKVDICVVFFSGFIYFFIIKCGMRGYMHHSKRNISSHQASRQEVAFLASKSWQQKSAPPPSRVAKVFQALQVDMAACLFDSGSLDAASEWDTSNRLKEKKKKMCVCGYNPEVRGSTSGVVTGNHTTNCCNLRDSQNCLKIDMFDDETRENSSDLRVSMVSCLTFLLDKAAKDAAVLSSLQQLVLSLELFVCECPWRCVCLSRDRGS